MNHCGICLDKCTNLNCSCLCDCFGQEYWNCLNNLNEILPKKESKECLDNFNDCLLDNDHFNCKICSEYRCCCLGNSIQYNHINYYKNYSRNYSKINRKYQNLKMKSVKKIEQINLINCKDEIYLKIDNNFRDLYYYFQDNQNLSNLYKLKQNLKLSLNELRHHNEYFNYKEQIEKLNFKLDLKLNKNFMKNYKLNDYLESDDFRDELSKFDLFVHLSLVHFNQIYDKLTYQYPEILKDNTIRNLILFFNKKRCSIDQLIKPNLQICLTKTIDTIQLNDNFKINKLFPTKLCELSIFKFLTFLIIDLNYNLIEPVQLQLNKLYSLKHLEIYGTKFKFKKFKSYNSSLSNLIIHDKEIKNLNILNFFPNLILIKIQKSKGDILKSNLIKNHFKYRCIFKQTELRVINIPNLSFNDFAFILDHCNKLEYLECDLIYPRIGVFIKYLPYLKFAFFNFKEDQFKFSNTVAKLIYSKLDNLTNENLIFYSNHLYCPKQFNLLDAPCYKLNCLNCKFNQKIYNRINLLDNSNYYLSDMINKFKDYTYTDSCLEYFGIKYRKLRSNLPKLNKLSKSLNDLSMIVRKPIMKNFKNINKLIIKSNTEMDHLNKLNQIEFDYHQNLKKIKQNEIKHCIVYLNGIKLVKENLNKFTKVCELIEQLNYLKISELNELINLFGLEMIKEKLFNIKFIEIDESIDLNLIDNFKLSSFIKYTTGLIITNLTFSTIDFLIRQMPFIKTIKFYDIKLDKKICNYFEINLQNTFKQLNSFEFYSNDITELDIKFLLNCESLNELKLINTYFNNCYLFNILKNNKYCSTIELSYPLTKSNQRKLIEILTFNALINKQIDYRIKFTRDQSLDIDLLPNFKIEE